MSGKYTPGPWHAEIECHDSDDFEASVHCADDLFDEPYYCTEIAERIHNKYDAFLIAAAPELLEACEKAYAHLMLLRPLTGDDDFEYFRAAIAKAKGEEHA